MREDWEELAKEHSECRCFIEFADRHKKEFYAFLNEVLKA